jgi:hypothetical protein
MMNIRTSVTVSHGEHARIVPQTYQRAESHGNGHQLIVGTGPTVFDHCGEGDITMLNCLNDEFREVDSTEELENPG